LRETTFRPCLIGRVYVGDLEQCALVVGESRGASGDLSLRGDVGDLDGAMSGGLAYAKLASRSVHAPGLLTLLMRFNLRRIGLRQPDPLGDMLGALKGRQFGAVEVLADLQKPAFDIALADNARVDPFPA
jgi:hypothetical protein